jgi:hypothetical protein
VPQHSSKKTRSIMDLFATLSTITLYIKCQYAKCHVLFIVVLNVVMLNVAMLNAAMLNVVMLNVAMRSVMAPLEAQSGTNRLTFKYSSYDNLA